MALALSYRDLQMIRLPFVPRKEKKMCVSDGAKPIVRTLGIGIVGCFEHAAVTRHAILFLDGFRLELLPG